MEFHFLIDRDTERPHVENHHIETWEAIDVLKKPDFDYNGRESTRIAIDQTRNGRYLRMIYRRIEKEDARFIITAYDLPPKARAALRRRKRK